MLASFSRCAFIMHACALSGTAACLRPSGEPCWTADPTQHMTGSAMQFQVICIYNYIICVSKLNGDLCQEPSVSCISHHDSPPADIPGKVQDKPAALWRRLRPQLWPVVASWLAMAMERFWGAACCLPRPFGLQWPWLADVWNLASVGTPKGWLRGCQWLGELQWGRPGRLVEQKLWQVFLFCGQQAANPSLRTRTRLGEEWVRR